MNRPAATQTHQQKPAATPAASGVLQRKCACGNHTIAGGECAECRKKKLFGLQTKLKVNEPGDIYEQEADRTADQVMAKPAHNVINTAPPRIQRFSGHSNSHTVAVPASVDRVLASPGRPLEPALRQDMEQRFSHDFSRVRLHTGAAAEQSAEDVNANAYTAGHNVVFGAGQFAPDTHEGRLLIAHELTHVVQQSGANAHHAAGNRAVSTILQRTPGPGKPAPFEIKVRERIDAFRRGMTRAQELRQIADRLIEQELGSAPKRSLSARRNGLAEIARRGGPQADVARRLDGALAEIEADLNRRAAAVTSVADDLIESRLGARPKTPRARANALRNLGKEGAGMERQLREIEEELTARQPGRATASKFAKAEEDAAETAAKTEHAAGKSGEAATMAEKSAAETHQGTTMPKPQSPIESPFPGSGMPEPVPEPGPSIGARLRAAPGSFAEGFKGAFSAENIAAMIPIVILTIADRVAAREAIRNIAVKFAKEGFAKGFAAGVTGWSKEEVSSNLKNRVTSFRVQGLEDPAGLLTREYILKLAESYENYAVDVGYQFSSSKTLKWKKHMRDRGFAVLAKYGYLIGRQEPSRPAVTRVHLGNVIIEEELDPSESSAESERYEFNFDYDFIDKLAWVLHPTTDPIVEDAIEKGR